MHPKLGVDEVISLLTTRLRKAIDRGKTASEVLTVLSEEGYLSDAALRHPEEVVAAIQRALDGWNTAEPGTGDESSRHIERELKTRGYLSTRALTSGAEPVQRW